MHLKRWLTSIVAIPLLLLLIFKGGAFLFALFMGIVSFLGSVEYSRITAGKNDTFQIKAVTSVGLLSGLMIILTAYANQVALIPLILSFSLLMTGIVILRLFQDEPDVAKNVAFQLMGMVYIPLALSYSVLIRLEPAGEIWVLFIACVVFAGDTAAYYAGTYFGRHKLCPSVSPGKTIEGALGGIAANLAVGAVFSYYFLPGLALEALLFFCLTIGIAGQVGDLFESVLKRSAGVKDSGALLPGHGGILDRIDAALFALPVAYFMKVFLFTQQIIR